jgi:dipeptidyl aminopeptidase/acylaminoacyl peptidase
MNRSNHFLAPFRLPRLQQLARPLRLLLTALISSLGLQAQAADLAARSAAARYQSAKPAKRYTIEQFMATTSIGTASFSADESRILFHSNETGIFNVYAIPVLGGKPAALTASKSDSHYAVSYFPADDRILFTRDQGGNELNHLYVREADGAERDLTPGDKLKARFLDWSDDGTSFYVSSNERDARYFDLYRYDTRTYARSLVFKNEQGLDIQDISRDGRWVALSKSNTTADSDVHLLDLTSGAIQRITPHQGVASYTSQTFDPGSQRLLMTTNDGGEFTRLVAYELATSKTVDVEKADWDIDYSYFSKDGSYRVTGINADASIHLRLTRNGQPVALPKLPDGEIRGVTFSRSGQRMAFYVNGDRSPNNLFVHDFKTGKTVQLTQSLAKAIDPNQLVDARIVRFKSFDGLVIPSVFMLPKEASTTNKVPALVFVHGGPGGQTTRGYSALMQYFVNNGYAVLGINNRGSSGYGKTFFTADDGKHGREPLWDCVEAKTYLASTGVIDPERIGIIGGSYGGYMTLAALAFRPEAFKVGIDIFGVSNWIRTLESIPPYWESFRAALYQEIGDPVKERDFLVATSPLFHAKQIRKPLMVIQGANDPRVIKPESDDIVASVKANGVPVEYLVFADEGHGFSKKANQTEANRRMVEFLDKYLKPGPGAAR